MTVTLVPPGETVPCFVLFCFGFRRGANDSSVGATCLGTDRSTSARWRSRTVHRLPLNLLGNAKRAYRLNVVAWVSAFLMCSQKTVQPSQYSLLLLCSFSRFPFRVFCGLLCLFELLLSFPVVACYASTTLLTTSPVQLSVRSEGAHCTIILLQHL